MSINNNKTLLNLTFKLNITFKDLLKLYKINCVSKLLILQHYKVNLRFYRNFINLSAYQVA
jgi:hypothetical protein